MKVILKKLSILLLILATSCSIFAAEPAQPAKPAEPKIYKVQTLQKLAGDFFDANQSLISLVANLEERLLQNTVIAQKFINTTLANIAAQMINDNESRYDLNNPLTKFTQQYPMLAQALENEQLSYSLSIQDLLDAGAKIQLRSEFFTRNYLYLSNLSLTSLNGLNNIPNINYVLSLYLGNNQFTTLDPSTFNDLTASLALLHLGGNQFTAKEKNVIQTALRARGLHGSLTI